MGGACSVFWEEERRIQGFSGEPGGKRPLRRPRSRWEDNIKVGLQDMAGGMDWIDLDQGRDGWPDIVKEGINSRVAKIRGTS